MHTGTEEEVVVAAWEGALVEEELQDEPDYGDGTVQPDGVVPQHGQDERDRAHLKGAVKEESWEEPV